jgi:hypothetical protein
MFFESSTIPLENDDAAVAERALAARLARRTALLIEASRGVESSGRDPCLCQQAVAIIGVYQSTSGLGERRHDSLLCKLRHAQEIDGEARNKKALGKVEKTPVRHVKHKLSNLSTVGCRVVAQLIVVGAIESSLWKTESS